MRSWRSIPRTGARQVVEAAHRGRRVRLPAGAANCLEKAGPDFDFGTPAVLVTTREGQRPDPARAEVGDGLRASIPIARASCSGSTAPGRARSGAAFSGASPRTATRVFLPVSDIRTPTPGGLHAVSLSTGERVWYQPPPPLKCAVGPDLQCRADLGADAHPRRALLRIERRRDARPRHRRRIGDLGVRHQSRLRDAQPASARTAAPSRVPDRPSPAAWCMSTPATAITSAARATSCSRSACRSHYLPLQARRGKPRIGAESPRT